jgi:hypothetical protein
MRGTAVSCVGLSLLVAACSVVERRSGEERYCRAALAELTRNGPGARVENASTNPRTIDGRRVAAVTLTYDQGPTKRLMTCFFHAGAVRPMAINYLGRPLSQQRLDSLHNRIGR